PPPGYHTWHAFNRAFELLGISADYWARFDRLVGLGWALQSTAKPVQEAVNPALPGDVVARLRRQWLQMTPPEADGAFMSFPSRPGISRPAGARVFGAAGPPPRPRRHRPQSGSAP